MFLLYICIPKLVIVGYSAKGISATDTLPVHYQCLGSDVALNKSKFIIIIIIILLLLLLLLL